MGAQLIKGYSLDGDSQGVAGFNKIWKLYKGKKEQTKALATVFLIEKKQLKKGEKDQSIKCAKKEAGSLLRVRHPGILAIVEPLTEDDNILAFVTERVQGNISQLIKQNKFTQFIASQLELKLYLYPFLETISFIHDSLKQAHLALALDNIYISSDGKWKLAGFGVNQLLTGEDTQTTEQKFYDFTFSAPQLVLNKTYSKRSDIFSIGIIIIRLLEYIHKDYRPIVIATKAEYQKNIDSFKKITNSPVIKKSNNPSDLQALISGVLSWQSVSRWGVSQILSSKWMNDSTLITVKYLDKISSYENKQQLQFLKGLAGVLNDFDARVVSKIILPKLIDLLKYGYLIASIVYIIIDLLKKNKLSADLFLKIVWPPLKTITQGKEMTAQAIYLLVYNQQVLQKFIGEADNITYILPLFIKCFDCPPKLKQLALRNLQRLSKKLDYQIFKTRIIPKLLGILKDPSIDIRKDGLRGLYAIIRIIDVQTMSLGVLPAIESARKAGSDPFINAIINHIYNILSATLPSDILSSKILPVLIPYLSDPSINKSQFQQFKNTIINMIGKIQKDREKAFDSSMVNEQIKFSENDFKFAVEEEKKSQDKGNYNFLVNYMEKKEQSNTQNMPGTETEHTKPIENKSTVIQPITNNPPLANSTMYNQPMNSMGIPSLNITNSLGYDQPMNTMYNQPISSIGIQSPKLQFSLPQSHFSSVNVKIEPIIMPKIEQQSKLSYQAPLQFDFDALNTFGLTPAPQIKKVPPMQIKSPQIKAEKEFKIQNMTIKQPVSPVINNKAQSKPLDLSKKDSKKERKFIGGASGPMEINRLSINKINPIKSPNNEMKLEKMKIQNINSNAFNFDYLANNVAPSNDSSPISNIKIDNFDSFNMGLDSFKPPQIKPIKKPNQTNNAQSVNMGGLGFNMGGSNDDANNPFAQLQSNPKYEQPFAFSSIKSQPSSTQPVQSGDIYSYFEQSTPSNTNTTSSNPFDLI